MNRLQKVMAHAGVASRRKCEKIIAEGRVTVNDEKITTPGYKVSATDEVCVDGKVISGEKLVYYVLNKPVGVISSAQDQFDRLTVTDLITETDKRIYPVGRLDYDTTGVLLLTNDGELTNHLLHPRNELVKQYEARVTGIPSKSALKRLEKGVVIDGHLTAPAKVSLLKTYPDNADSLIRLAIHEGRYHQVKLMLAAINHPVKSLHRVAFGPISDKNLKIGAYRKLSEQEVKTLKA